MHKGKASDQMTHVWFRRRTLPERKGEPCRVLARGHGPGPRNVLVEFGDGHLVVADRFALRRGGER